MSRSKRKRKKLKQHLRNWKSTYLAVTLTVSSSVIIMVLANMLIKEESRYKTTVQKIVGSPQERYQRALGFEVEGDMEQARVLMFNLARLGDSAENALGYGKAHLWVAKDKLSHFDRDFIWKFPGIDQRGDNILALPEDEETETIQLHLAHANALNPEFEEAAALWAATLASQGKRNRAIEVLMNAIAHENHPQPKLYAPLIHVLAMEGNDLELRDSALYLFTDLGRTTRNTRGRNIADRVTYIISALILERYEIADNALQILEARFPARKDSSRMSHDPTYEALAEQVKALRMAFHYRKAMKAFSTAQSAGGSGYANAVDELEKVVLLYPDCDSAIAALSYIADRDSAQKERITAILQEVLSVTASAKESQSKSRVNISLAKLDSGSEQDKRKLLEDAVSSDPNNAEVILDLTGLLLREENPDYARVEQMIRKALRNCDRVYHPDLYHRLGEVQVHDENWTQAIVSLERSLANASSKDAVHRLLATAYQGIGQPRMAKQHQNLALKAAQ